MPSLFTLLGSKEIGAADVAHLIGEVLSVSLPVRESSFKGGEYFFSRDSGGMEISVERHVRDEEGEYAEAEFSDYQTLVYINYGNSDVEQRIAAISGLRLLRSETV
ncbi:hypothetical protein ACSNOJ_22150 [Streptomyces sp. URMC 128]|uniref:hypothetical protein n=1 Tax=Streptomyces sp. URMC 128 TaxID=3423404 RepID=UPI003F1DE903